jgi:ATP-dependent Lon protease
MRDFRDAKAMAQTLRTSLTAKAVTISHSESLELVSKMFGVADWNTLSAQIQAGREGPAKHAANERAASHPAIPLRDLVPFPSEMVPLFVGRQKTIRALDRAFQRQREVVIAIQKTSGVDEPGRDDVYDIGVLAGVLDLIHMGDGTVKVLTQIYRRVAISNFFGDPSGYIAEVNDLSEGPIPDAPDLIRTAIAHFTTYAEKHDLRIPQALLPSLFGQVREPDMVADLVARQVRDPGRVADIIAAQIKLPIPDKQALLATLDPVARLDRVDALLLAGQEGD